MIELSDLELAFLIEALASEIKCLDGELLADLEARRELKRRLEITLDRRHAPPLRN